MAGDARAVMLFDGVCNFCNFTVRFVLPRDPAGRVRFATMQSPAGQAMLRRLGMPLDDYQTFAVLQQGRLYPRLDGVLRLAASMRWPWPLLGLCRFVPRRIRDGLYDLVARGAACRARRSAAGSCRTSPICIPCRTPSLFHYWRTHEDRRRFPDQRDRHRSCGHPE